MQMWGCSFRTPLGLLVTLLSDNVVCQLREELRRKRCPSGSLKQERIGQHGPECFRGDGIVLCPLFECVSKIEQNSPAGLLHAEAINRLWYGAHRAPPACA